MLEQVLNISIHAPTRGATFTPNAIAIISSYFNPRSHERSDNSLVLFAVLFLISIHAPTRGATSGSLLILNTPFISIHAPTRGATKVCGEIVDRVVFQSTLPREERQDSHSLIIYPEDFNPRSHERSDTDSERYFPLLVISIHAPTRGATGTLARFNESRVNFNPRSHERSDSNIAQKICLFLYNTDNKYIIR